MVGQRLTYVTNLIAVVAGLGGRLKGRLSIHVDGGLGGCLFGFGLFLLRVGGMI